MSWAHYILQANIYLVLFYGFYKLFLAKETYFILNRIYLISAGICSLSIPFLRFEWFGNQAAATPIYTGVDQLNDLMTQVSVGSDAPEKLSPGNVIVAIYLTGLLIFALLFIYKLLKVQRLLQEEHVGNAFSFFRKKRIDTNLPEVQTIDKHEEIHIRQWHTLDVLFFELLAVFTWFNPIIYFYKHTIKNIHEYLADEEAARFQGDKEQYALLLLSRAFNIAPSSLTNTFFNKSLIKKRIFMLHKQRSKKTAVLKYGLFLPLFAITLVMSSATIRSNESIIAVTEEIPLNTPLNVVKDVISAPIEIAVSNMKREAVIKPQNVTDPAWEGFYNYLKRGIRYPAEAYNTDLQGNSQIKFSLKDGHIGAISVVNKLGSGFETEVMRIVLSYRDFKSSQDGNYSLPVSFILSGATSAKKNLKLSPVKGYKSLSKITVMGYKSESANANVIPVEEIRTDPNDVKVYDFVSIDRQPGFPGGMERFYKYLSKTVKYPAEAQEKNVQGKVFLSFIVEKNGDLADIKVERKLGAGTDEEAVRVLKASPKWIPGVYHGKTVRVKYNIPISFSLTSDPPAGNRTGKVIGLNVTEGTDKKLKLTGLGTGKDPLILVDGKKPETSINEINPNNIESIEVLKESATTLYGSAGANGVILIKTKAALQTKQKEDKKD
ncbi:TonB family C-terminal domain-containing protein [Pedobacter steynii]|uniref:TonB family C-terminal domain-containing protein n=1 Tax=Pedobacter steynii TaxID=430522 RepID=A0A1H0F6B9_9SPHI|nr:M56 family metallopeptidase [Pedobacter steynii]NQX42200.1 TonB family protein [Pedobacter steynii]SDN90109.1 TonB family C-terminal domain-containing protein [Pedobacter steynii]